ncbi:MAG: sigma-70 family RNA polymerase sigma factor [Pseudomonadota bacterium]
MSKHVTHTPLLPGDADTVAGHHSERAPAGRKPASIETFYHRYAGQLAASLRKIYGDGPPDPEDVSQHAFQKLMERGDLEQIKNVQAFVWRTARNIIADERRSKDVRVKYDYEVERIFFPLKDDVLTPEHVLAMRQQLDAVRGIIRKMPEKRRRALILHRVEGLSMAETARRMGTTRPTVAAHIAKAMTDLSVLFWDQGKRI